MVRSLTVAVVLLSAWPCYAQRLDALSRIMREERKQSERDAEDELRAVRVAQEARNARRIWLEEAPARQAEELVALRNEVAALRAELASLRAVLERLAKGGGE